MVFKAKHLQRWIDEHAPGEIPIAHTPAVSLAGVAFVAPGPSGVATRVSADDAGAEQRTDLVEELGYREDQRVGRGTDNAFYLLTDRRFILGSRSSTRNRPKDLVHAVPRADVRLHWFDEPVASTHSRNFVVEFGDGTYRTDKIGITILGKPQPMDEASKALIAELGDQAVRY